AAVLGDVQARLAERAEFNGVLLRQGLAELRTDGGGFVRREATSAGAAGSAHIQASLGALSTIGVRVLDGRPLEASDDASRAPVALISRALATRYWGRRSPVGEQLRLTGVGDTTSWRTIVGVVSDVPYGDPLSRDRSPEAIYLPLLQSGADVATVLVRYRSSEIAGREALYQAITQLDPLLIPDSVQPYAEVLRKVSLITVSVVRLFAACFAFALLLAVAGAYGLMARAVVLRRREVGVRRALGASDGNLTRLLLARGGRQLGAGALLAMPLLLATGAGFMHFFPVEPWLAVLAGIGVTLSIVGIVLAASWLPTRQVLRVSPREALWSD
ncbi:MAG: FtsX-like permease family protein, partial [Gemmatimonadaceae bacterium]